MHLSLLSADAAGLASWAFVGCVGLKILCVRLGVPQRWRGGPLAVSAPVWWGSKLASVGVCGSGAVLAQAQGQPGAARVFVGLLAAVAALVALQAWRRATRLRAQARAQAHGQAHPAPGSGTPPEA